MRTLAFPLVAAASLAACTGAQAPAPACPETPAAVEPAPAPAAAVTAPKPPCDAAEYRQFDFWLGEWDLVVKTATPDGTGWNEARGTQHIEARLGGCVIAEHFHADGPAQPWAGESVSSWQAGPRRWRQTWVDDQGGYLAFTGGLDNGVMTLDGEPFAKDGKTIQMRMVFLDVTADALRWEWQRSTDGGATWVPRMIIEYTRRAAPAAGS
jgi:hypothetical protein